MQNAGPCAISSSMATGSLGSLLELRALLDVLESQRAPARSVLRVESMKTGFELAEANSHPAGASGQLSGLRAVHRPLDTVAANEAARQQKRTSLPISCFQLHSQVVQDVAGM
jgi:hypothetical protein